MISVLTIVSLLSGALLALVYSYASPLILRNQKSKTESAIFKIFPKGDHYDKEPTGGKPVFKVKDKTGKLLGYAFIAEGNALKNRIVLKHETRSGKIRG